MMTGSQAAKESSKQSTPATPKFEIHQNISSGVSRKNSKRDQISLQQMQRGDKSPLDTQKVRSDERWGSESLRNESAVDTTQTETKRLQRLAPYGVHIGSHWSTHGLPLGDKGIDICVWLPLGSLCDYIGLHRVAQCGPTATYHILPEDSTTRLSYYENLLGKYRYKAINVNWSSQTVLQLGAPGSTLGKSWVYQGTPQVDTVWVG
ncbi:hypothetical protein C8J57DRAFT_1656571 [Mycena rebaudengoi]|nr:hypothetical protein C8J57DRAFT_1656571 [Mycena rebaudengoi]